MTYALRTSCAKNIIGVIPYFPYSKQSKMRKRGSIVCKLLASMLSNAGRWELLDVTLYYCGHYDDNHTLEFSHNRNLSPVHSDEDGYNTRLSLAVP